MTITFRVRFSTNPGQSLWLAGTHPLPAHAMPMNYIDSEFWELSVPLCPQASRSPLNYSYILANSDGAQVTDWGQDRKFVPTDYECLELLVVDSWNHAGYVENVFYTEPFKDVLLAENATAFETELPKSPTHTFRVKAPQLKKNQTVCLLGEGVSLGRWDTNAPVLLGRQPSDVFYSVTLDLRGHGFPMDYKYGVFDLEKNSFVRYEEGPNRTVTDPIRQDLRAVLNDGFIRLPVEHWRGAGVAVPVFSLRSENSFGVGEFADLKLLADWGKKAGLKLIQLLPVNDTSATGTWKDSYPYAAISAFALHPIYLNLAALANGKSRELLKELEPERQRLNALDSLDYEAVMKAKLDFLWKIFPSEKADTFRKSEYKEFFAENEHWLLPYAAFCFFRDKFGTSDFSKWPEHQQFDAAKIADLVTSGRTPHGTVQDEMAFHYFVQFHLHSQLKDAAAHIHEAGLILKGDIAIGVYRYSADTWQRPDLYHMDMQAGAPPDPFSDKGQNWGFPTYNWPRMAADGFAWWKQRLAQMGNYFDAFRIDHILGFFRIWSIPAHAVEGILGHFVPALPLDPGELTGRGIYLQRERLTKPFINDELLKEAFGSDAKMVQHTFLLAGPAGTYSLRAEFVTQRLVEKYFTTQEQGEKNTKLKIGLFDLISDVILLESEGKFHIRLGMEKTASFKNLPPETQKKLYDLYVDYFFRRQDDFWMREAMKKLPVLKRVTDMLICGEDLGMVPACVPEVMRDLGLLSLEIQRMPKGLGAEFSRPANAPYLSVVTPSTHDMSTIRGWWEESHELTQKFFNHELGLAGEAPPKADPRIVQVIVKQHLDSPAMWSIFQLQDLLGMDGQLRRADVAAERINVPALPNFYWRYRLHLTLEKLLQADGFNSQLKQMIAEAGRR